MMKPRQRWISTRAHDLDEGQAATGSSSSAAVSTGVGSRPGRRNAAATAPARHSRPTTMQAVDIADMNESWNAATSCGSRPATDWATPTESCARVTTDPGSAPKAPDARCAPNTEEKIEP